MTICEVCGKSIWVGALLASAELAEGTRKLPGAWVSAWVHEQLDEDHAARPAPELPLGQPEKAPAAVPVCPDCWVGKHANCGGYSWDNAADDFAPCPCAQAGHQEAQEGTHSDASQ